MREASVIKLRPEMAARYRQLHADVWPEVLAALRAAHMTNVTIFLRDGLLFKYLEYTGDDFAVDVARVAAEPATQRWWALTSPCQQRLESVAEGQWWAPAEEVFRLD